MRGKKYPEDEKRLFLNRFSPVMSYWLNGDDPVYPPLAQLTGLSGTKRTSFGEPALYER